MRKLNQPISLAEVRRARKSATFTSDYILISTCKSFQKGKSRELRDWCLDNTKSGWFVFTAETPDADVDSNPKLSRWERKMRRSPSIIESSTLYFIFGFESKEDAILFKLSVTF